MKSSFVTLIDNKLDVHQYGLIQGNWEQALKKSNVNNSKISEASKNIEKEVSINKKGLSDTLEDYAVYSYDKIHVVFVAISIIISMIVILTNWYYSAQTIQNKMLHVIIAFLIAIILFSIAIINHFQNKGIHDHADKTIFRIRFVPLSVILLNIFISLLIVYYHFY